MERAVAIKKLSKYFGKSFGYRIDPKAPDQEERDAALVELRQAIPRRGAISRAMEDRREKVLHADAEYQRLKLEYAEAEKACSALSSITRHYRITVGTSNSMFFHVKAQGDTWEQVIGKLNEKVLS